MAVPDRVLELVDRFSYNHSSYRSGRYNETQVRREFIDPLFESLGWDIHNSQGWAEAYKDVIHEDAIKIGSQTKAPDYSFRIGGTRKFFLEAKKPSVNVREDMPPAFQLRRYAWSAKLPLSILTDFEEFAVYDCRIQPSPNDRASTARIQYITFREYPDRWDELMGVFSPEAIRKGSFDKYAADTKSKKGTAEVDDAFLKEIESWRELLAKNIALRNPMLMQRELNTAVQKTIDRIIFLRICEDRGIEPYNTLGDLQKGANVYNRMGYLFQRADDRYNSGLFHFHQEKNRAEEPDTFTLGLTIDDKPLKEILKGLYYPHSPYEFSVLPADILGQIYEQFLGKVIVLDDRHRATIEEKPEVKKAGGVYYTPTYIVDYIVENTVGKLLEGKTPNQISDQGKTPSLRLLDPACGSGSFLIGAYQHILDWHLAWYVANEPEKYAKGRSPRLYVGKAQDWRLTTDERKRILLTHIYGVDIDAQAVEVTKLSLLLKMLEGENNDTLNAQTALFQTRVLPDLETNIKSGNSLIGSDFYDNVQINIFDEAERYRINVFDWEDEFTQVFADNGFDVVSGNPPYGYMMSKAEQNYYKSSYRSQNYQNDYYLLFLERYQRLLKDNGFLSVIISNTWLQSITFKGMRKYMSEEYTWDKILHLPKPVFKAVIDTHVVVFRNKRFDEKSGGSLVVEVELDRQISKMHEIPLNALPKTGEPINIVQSLEAQNLYRKIVGQSKPLSHFCDVFNGVKPFEKGKGTPPQTDEVMKLKPYVAKRRLKGDSWKPLLRGSSINRYRLLWNEDYWIKYGPWLAAPRDPGIFSASQKIMVRQTGDSLIATLVYKDFVGRNNLHILLLKNEQTNLFYILGLINSKLMDFAYTSVNPEKGEALAEVKKWHIEQLPVKLTNSVKSENTGQPNKIADLAKTVLTLHKSHQDANTSQEKKLLERQIKSIERQIDQLIYKLYELTTEEIALVDGDNKASFGRGD